MTRNPELIVPIRDRRRRKRILTLKNAQRAGIATLVLVLALTVVSEIRDRRPIDGYGRLLDKQVSVPAPQVQKTPQIVTEGPIADQEHADPMLLSAAAREQYLGVTPTTASVVPMATPEPVAPAPVATQGHVTLVGDANGVTIVKSETPQRGQLGGGIFKQQQ